MKTYMKNYEVVEVKGFLDIDENGKKFIKYDNENKESTMISLDDVIDMMIGKDVILKTVID